MLRCTFCDEYIVSGADYISVSEGIFHISCYDRYIQRCVENAAAETKGDYENV